MRSDGIDMGIVELTLRRRFWEIDGLYVSGFCKTKGLIISFVSYIAYYNTIQGLVYTSARRRCLKISYVIRCDDLISCGLRLTSPELRAFAFRVPSSELAKAMLFTVLFFFQRRSKFVFK